MSILNVNQIQPVGGGNTITVGSSNIDYSGSITGNISVDGNLTVTGVVSNEDVTNIDSVGIITARSGIRIGGDANNGTAEGIKLDEYGFIQISRGDGVSALWAGYTQGSSTQTSRIDNDGDAHFLGKLAIGFNAPAVEGLSISNSSTNRGFEFDTGSGFDSTSCIRAYDRPTTAYKSLGLTGSDIKFGINDVEKVRVDSSGRLLLGTTDAGSSAANNLVVANNGSAGDRAGITIRGGTSGRSQIFFSDGTSGQDEYRGMLRYDHSENSMQFRTDAAERMRITSAGQVIVNGTANLAHPNMDDIIVGDASGNRGITVASGSSGYGTLAFGDSTDGSGNDRYQGFVEYYHSENSLRLGTVAQERFRISNIGHITTKGNNQGNPVGIEIRNNNSNAYSHAELSLTSQNATTSKIWCDVPNSGMRLNYNGGSSVKIDQSGNLHMPNGAGIDFSATANSSGSMGSELLDDYEEGSWTPAIDNLTNTPAYDNLSGRYTRIGRLVHLMGFIQINGSSTPTYSNESSAWSLSGLPFARSNTNAVGYVGARGIIHGQNFQYNGSFNDYGTTGVVNIGFISSTALGLYVTGSGNGTIRGQVRRSSMKNTFIIEFDIVYNA